MKRFGFFLLWIVCEMQRWWWRHTSWQNVFNEYEIETFFFHLALFITQTHTLTVYTNWFKNGYLLLWITFIWHHFLIVFWLLTKVCLQNFWSLTPFVIRYLRCSLPLVSFFFYFVHAHLLHTYQGFPLYSCSSSHFVIAFRWCGNGSKSLNGCTASS